MDILKQTSVPFVRTLNGQFWHIQLPIQYKGETQTTNSQNNLITDPVKIPKSKVWNVYAAFLSPECRI